MKEATNVSEMSGKCSLTGIAGQSGRYLNPSRLSLAGEKMLKAKCDRKGRIQLKASMISKYGDEFFVVQAPGKLILFPIPDDPVKDLEEWGKPLQHMSLKEIKSIIDKRAREEVGF